MAIEKLINHSQGEDIKTALNTIATNIQTVGAVSPETLGMGFTTCSTEQATAAKTATLTGYTITDGGIVSVKFSNAVNAGATLNINSQGAKPIYYKGAAITNSIINAGAIATFVYSNNQYQLINLDTDVEQVQTNKNNISTVEHANGSKNVLDFNLDSLKTDNPNVTCVDNVFSVGNLNLTYNSDNNTIAISGRHIAQVVFAISKNLTSSLSGQILSGGRTGADIRVQHDGGNYETYATSRDSSAVIASIPTGYNIKTIIVVPADTDVDTVLYPMICDSALYSIDNTYQPYAMSNVELTAATSQNSGDILTEQEKTVGMSAGGSDHITVNGIPFYVSNTVPTGDIPDGSIGVGW